MAGATCGGRRLEQKRRLQEAAKVDYATWNAREPWNTSIAEPWKTPHFSW